MGITNNYFYRFSTLYGGRRMSYKVVTFIDPDNDGSIFGKTYFKTYEEADTFADSFESLRSDCVAFVEEIEND